MRGVVLNYHHAYTFFYFVVLILLLRAFSMDVNILSSEESLTISSNRTIVSSGEVFELGFFKTASNSQNGDRWYLGIWYKTIPERTYVWIANRDNPLSNSIGTLKIFDNNLVLLDQSYTTVWSTNLTGAVSSSVVAELLSTGNFVLRDTKTNDPDVFLWQSFDFPTDTLLPHMKLGWDNKTGHNRSLRSWRSLYDPSSGDLSYKLETRGLPDFFIWKTDVRVYRSGPWDGTRFSGIPEMPRWNFIVNNLTENREEITYTYRVNDHNIYSRLILSSSGVLQQFTWSPNDQEWSMFWTSPKDMCDAYRKCGPYSYCDTNTSPMCNCFRGFRPKFPQAWLLRDGSSGCVRKTRVSCGRERFVQLNNLKMPDTMEAVVDRRIGVKECRERCTRDCNCTGFTNIRNDGSGCVMWTGELVDMRKYGDGGQNLYVRVAAVDLGEKKNKIRGKIVGLIVGISILLLLSFVTFCFWKRKQKQAREISSTIVNQERNQNLLMNGVVITSRRHLSGDNITDDLELPLMELEAIVTATDNFSDFNKLGQGGFGIVYKGILPDGKEIAVKRLSEMSKQGTIEFQNEVRLIAKLQHINLVRLLGWCANVDEKMLIYEYLENLSLDFYLFDKTPSSKLNWQKRLDITTGIARGLLYLHQDSRFRIIHRDLKASNILLDKDMIPKISDFGMARIFGRDETEASTIRVVGTYGYMSPEYAMDGIFSVKSDVFSFGVLVLEIVSGKRNRGFYNLNHDTNLLGYAWRNWKEGKWLEIVDPFIIELSQSSPSAIQPQEIQRCIQIGLLCVQERAEDRPMMSSVVLMLGSETILIPQPKPPGYCVTRSLLETGSSSNKQPDEESVNQVTLSVIEAR